MKTTRLGYGWSKRMALVFATATFSIPLYAGSTFPPGRNYAQQLVNETIHKYPDLLVIAMHVIPPGQSDNVIIASNVGRIGKKADADDLKVINAGETLEKVSKNGKRFEVELTLQDQSKKPIGALAIVFPYKAGDDKVHLERKAEMIRDEMGKQITDISSLVRPISK